MKIYNYHPVTGEYTGQASARLDPKEPSEVYLIPAYATTDAPPPITEGQALVRDANAWTIEDDHRGEVWYDASTGAPVEINFIGTPTIALTDTEPTPLAPTWIDLRREAYRDRIGTYKGVPNASREDVIGYTIDALVNDRNGNATEANEISAIIAQVKIDIPKT